MYFDNLVCKFLEFYLFYDTEIWGPNFVSKWVFGFLRTLVYFVTNFFFKVQNNYFVLC